MQASLRYWCSVLLFCVGAANGAAPAGDACRQTPTAHCLIDNAMVHWVQLADATPARKELAAQLAFEARQSGIPIPASLRDAIGESSLATSLEREETYLRHLQHRDFERARNDIKQLPAPLQDFLRLPAEALLIEALTLALADQQADQLKKQYYETLLALDHPTRNRRMLAVARQEILGGQPRKGLQTLENTDIDAFSASEFFQSRIVTEWLAASSEQLFLRPDQTPGRCDQPADIAPALQYLLHDNLYVGLASSSDITDRRLRAEGFLLGAKLYRNSGQCDLLEKWLTAQAILLSRPADSIASTATALLDDVLLARTLRRYFHREAP